MTKILAVLFAMPTAIAPLMVMLNLATAVPAYAAEITPPTACLKSDHGRTFGTMVCLRVDAQQAKLARPQLDLAQPGNLEFTDEESDKSIAMFGCDCPICLNMLRQLRSLAS